MRYFVYFCKKIIVMPQVSMTVRMDSTLKSSFDALCAEFGMSSNTAMTIFAKAVVQRGRIPFEIQSNKVAAVSNGLNAFRAIRALAEAGEFPEMSVEEINREIELARLGK